MSSKIVKLNVHKLKADKITKKVNSIIRSIEDWKGSTNTGGRKGM
jgi:hypothetical protein